MKLSSFFRTVAVVAALACGSIAQAAPISGGVSFGGGWLPTGGTGIDDATGVDVIGETVFVNCALTSTCAGDYAGVTGVVVGTYVDFTFDPLPGGGVVPLWTFDFGGKTYSFDLLTVQVDDQDSDSLVLTGTGILKIDGFDDTPGVWTFSGDSSDQAVFAFSSTASTVPEPATLALLGLSLAGLAALRRRKQ